jgi:hypothetical protein
MLMGMESPDNRRKADDSYRTRFASVGAISSPAIAAATRECAMKGASSSMISVFWLVGHISGAPALARFIATGCWPAPDIPGPALKRLVCEWSDP